VFDTLVASEQVFAELIVIVNGWALATGGSGVSWETVATVVLDHFRNGFQSVRGGDLGVSHFHDVTELSFFDGSIGGVLGEGFGREETEGDKFLHVWVFVF